jgi:hypothetical protein
VSDFEVGQTVRHEVRGEVDVTYGPFVGLYGDGRYIVRQGDGREVMVNISALSAIPEPPKFAIGDKVTSDGSLRDTVGILVAGPFVSPLLGDRFWVADVDDRHHTPIEAGLRKVVDPAPIKVGDRVRVTDDDGGGANRFNGRIGTVTTLHGEGSSLPYLVEFGNGRGFHGELNGTWNCRSVERVEDETTYTHDGVTYDLTARYRDRDDDYWTFKNVEGTVRGNCASTNVATDVYNGHESLESAVRRYGPLTRVSA